MKAVMVNPARCVLEASTRFLPPPPIISLENMLVHRQNPKFCAFLLTCLKSMKAILWFRTFRSLFTIKKLVYINMFLLIKSLSFANLAMWSNYGG